MARLWWLKKKTTGQFLYHGNQRMDETDPEHMTIRFLDLLYRGSIRLVKYESGTETPLAGVSYRLEGAETGEIYRGTTDEDGEVFWENLAPQHYVLTELKTAEGMSLFEGAGSDHSPADLNCGTGRVRVCGYRAGCVGSGGRCLVFL